MRTIPTLLAAAVIAVGSTVLSTPAAHAYPGPTQCYAYTQFTDPWYACMQQQQQQTQWQSAHPCYSTGVDDQGNECYYVPPN
jgi:hypothetical protein